MTKMAGDIFIGDISNLPEEDSNVVRIFTSSTFTDMSVERNYLMKNVYPQLRNVCLELGLEFEVVDMRWGVSDKVSADHKTTELCLREISNCQRLSHGPNFITFLGDKYGYRPFPSTIAEQEFDVLVNILTDDARDVQILHQWFKKDENSIPPKYILQPIHEILLDYNNEHNTVKQAEDRNRWRRIFQEIKEHLSYAAIKALNTNVLPDKICEKYLISVTESEVNQGLFECKDPNKQCACFVRVLKDAHRTTDDESIKLYFDDNDLNSDFNPNQQLDYLRFEKIKNTLSVVNYNYFDVKWKKGGIDPSYNEHKKYLQKFGESVKTVLTNLIKEYSVNRRGRRDQSKLFKEVLHHGLFCSKKCQSFHGREELLNELKASLDLKPYNNNLDQTVKNNDNNQNRNIFTIHGASGSGKTSIMAMLAKNAKTWFNIPNLVVIFRFLGTSPSSSNINELIRSLCDQICEVYRFKKLDEYEGLNAVIKHFQHLLRQIQTTPLLMLLDSIDQLSPDDNAYTLNWLPEELNSNVFIVLSTLPDHGNILPTVKERHPNDKQYLEVGSLPKESSSIILQNWFAEANRKLTLRQQQHLESCYELCPQPIYLKLAFDQAIEWKSYDPENKTDLPVATTVIISSLFESLKVEFGERLVTNALGYITASKSGLSEGELEDVLSLDDMVLNDVYEFWDPPMNEHVRLPPLLWKRIRYQLNTYLTERTVDGTIVMNWYHRQFWEAATNKFLSDITQINHLYENLSDFFMGTYADGTGKDITLYKRMKVFKKADRLVHAQPLEFQNGAYNLRKLNELPPALIQCDKQDHLFDTVFFNFRWIYCKIKALSVNDVLKDMKLYLKKRHHEEVATVHDSLVLASTHIESEKESVANQLLGMLIGFEKLGGENIQKLLNGCRSHLETLNKPAFLVRSACMIPPGGPLRTTLQGHAARIEQVFFLRDSDNIVCTCRDDKIFYVYFWNIRMSRNIKMHQFKYDAYVTALYRKRWKHLIIVSDKFYYVNVHTLTVDHIVSNPYDVITYVKEEESDLAVVHKSGLLSMFSLGMKKTKVRYAHLKNISCVEFLVSSTEIIISSAVESTLDIINYNGNKVRHFNAADIKTKKSTMLLIMANDCTLLTVYGALIRVWDVIKLCLVDTLTTHTDTVLCLEKISSDIFASGSKDWSVKIWSVSQCLLLHDLLGHENAIWCLKYCEESNTLVSGSKDDYLKVWNLETLSCDHTLLGHSSWISAVDASKDCGTIISGSNDRKLKVWTVTRNQENQQQQQNKQELQQQQHQQQEVKQQPIFINHNKSCTGVAISPNSNLPVSISRGEKIILWDEEKTTFIDEIEVRPTCVSFHTNSNVIVGTNAGTVDIYDITKEIFVLQHSYQVHTKDVIELLILKESIISIGADGILAVSSLNSQVNPIKFDKHGGKAITCVHVSEDGNKIISAGKDSNINVFRVKIEFADVAHFITLEGHQHPVSSLASSVKYLFSGDMKGYVYIWELSDGKQVRKIQLSHDTITCLLSLPTNKVIVACHYFTEQLKILDIESEDTTMEFIGHLHAVMRIRCSVDLKYLFSSSRDGTIKLWEIATGELIDSINLNSQIKYFEISDLNEGYYFKMIAATKTGSISQIRVLLPQRNNRFDAKNSSAAVKKFSSQQDNQIPVQTAYCSIL